MQIKTKDLSDQALDWAVNQCEGLLVRFGANQDGSLWQDEINPYSSDHAAGGSILEREGIATRRMRCGRWYAILSSDLGDEAAPNWKVYTMENLPKTACTSRMQRFEGKTLLEAGLRCFVASRMGEVVDVLDELFQLQEEFEQMHTERMKG